MHRKTYNSWYAMKRRCNDRRHHKYPLYGGKGISYDPRWESYANFLADMGEKPLGRTLGRKDSKQDYSKDNCQWETDEQQNNNLSSNVWIEFNGKRQTAAQWARELGISSAAITTRRRKTDNPALILRRSRITSWN